MTDLTQARLKEMLHYDPNTGHFTWRERRTRRTDLIGTRAGWSDEYGYIKIKIAGRKFFTHRLAWLYVYGEWPTLDVIDHINRNPADNRIANLRCATFRENTLNNGKLNRSPHPGVFFVGWRADVFHKGRRIAVGCFRTAEEAIAAHKAAMDDIEEFIRRRNQRLKRVAA